MTSKKFILHVGMHKTGTSSLQIDVFPRLDGIYYVGDNLEDRKEFIEFLREVAWSNPAHFDMRRARKRLDELLAGVPEETVLVSFEELFGDLYWNFPNNFTVAQRLKELFPDACIFLVLRRQADWLESAWRQSLHAFQFRTLKTFLYYRDGEFGHRPVLDYRVGISALEMDYRPYVRNYAKLFGAQNLVVLPFEMLRSDSSRFYQNLSEVIGTEVSTPAASVSRKNRSFSAVSCLIAITLNRFIYCRDHSCGFIPDRPGYAYFAARRDRSTWWRILAGISARLSLPYILEKYVDRLQYWDWSFMDEQMRDDIFQRYQVPNRILDEEFSIGLKEYEYY